MGTSGLAALLGIAVLVAGLALTYTRWEYRKHGKLTLIGLTSLCAMLFVPNLVFHYTFSYEAPSTALGFAGAVVAAVGLIVCLAGILQFRSFPKVFCLEPGELTVRGIYRFSRNPQYAGWLVFLLGWLIGDWSLWGLGALAVVAASLHILVLIEEEHLRRVFSSRYDEFAAGVPRYFGFSGIRQ